MAKYINKISVWEPLLRVIRRAEASPDKPSKGTTQYDSVVSATPLPKLSSLSIKDAIKLVENKRPGKTYIGAYQFNKRNLIVGENWVGRSGLNGDDLFNKQNQDNIAIYLLEERRKGARWLNGTLSINSFMLNISKEWAGLPVPYDTKGFRVPVKSGQSFYSGVTTNKANVTVNLVKNALIQIQGGVIIKDELADNKSYGLPPVTSSYDVVPAVFDESQYLQYIQN